ncbi:MAG: TonB-dependent receptor [Alistipes sp.]|nr:TonB-dependent receptor [Alistipes sp.]
MFALSTNGKIMKTVSIILRTLTAITAAAVLSVQLTVGQATLHTISGQVLDEDGYPLAYTSVQIQGTLTGVSADTEGKFSFLTDEQGTVTLVVAFIGYETQTITRPVGELDGITVTLRGGFRQMQEVVVTAGNYRLKSASMLDGRSAVDMATTPGSEGDLYKSIALLPGTQVAGTDGKLLVRGGSSRESQTFIDGMHVLSPYTASYGMVSSRGRYSPFIFEGISFSMGGYSPEYTQSLSSVLPLETKDYSPASKVGVNVMNVSVGGGGTQAWSGGSASLDFTFTDLTFYNSLFHRSTKDIWKKPYRDYALQNQLRFDIGRNGVLKTYATWSKTGFDYLQSDPFTTDTRNLGYDENDLYLNTTFKTKTGNGTALFAGAAYARNEKDITGGLVAGDRVHILDSEIHLKAKASHRFGNTYKFEAGVETYLKTYDFSYADTDRFREKLDGNISGLFFSNDFTIARRWFLNLSARGEYGSADDSFAFLPRAALSWQRDGLTVSGAAGIYQQAAEEDYLLRNPGMRMERNYQSLLGAYYEKRGRIYRAELYDKRYRRLPLEADGIYTANGKGYSRGIDLFFDDRELIRNFEYIVGYSFNDSKRRYLDFPETATPTYAMRHNASLTVKYNNWNLRSIVGLTARYASGRPYDDPNSNRFMAGRTPHYMSLDASLTVLPCRQVILYFSASNILNRKNVYGYNFSPGPDSSGRYASSPVGLYQNQSFYMGIFINLGRNVAYEASHF